MNGTLLNYPMKKLENDFKRVPVCPYCQSDKVEKRKDGRYLCPKCIEVFEWE